VQAKTYGRNKQLLDLVRGLLQLRTRTLLGVLALDENVEVILEMLPVWLAAIRFLLIVKREFGFASFLVTFFVSRNEPRPRTMILQPVSCSSCLAVIPRGPRMRPTKLNCLILFWFMVYLFNPSYLRMLLCWHIDFLLECDNVLVRFQLR